MDEYCTVDPTNRHLTEEVNLPVAAPSGDGLVNQIVAGKYEVLEVAGQGAWSTVYKARHIGANHLVALKVLQSHLVSDDSKLKRFQKEAEIAGRLNHPNIVRIDDYGLLETGQPYIVMEYLHGETMATAVKNKGRLDPSICIDLFHQLAEALTVAHNAGLIHRDIKPSNIFLVPLQGTKNLRAKFLDFGIVKVSDATDDAVNLTRTGEILGSPSYMSPEQCQGHRLDGTSDIYSLGCTLYEALSGIQAFSAPSVFECMRKHLNEQPAPLVQCVPSIKFPPKLQAVLDSTLAVEPSLRVRSAENLALCLQHIREKRYAKVDRLLGIGEKKDIARNRRTAVVGLACVLATGLAALLLWPKTLAPVSQPSTNIDGPSHVSVPPKALDPTAQRLPQSFIEDESQRATSRLKAGLTELDEHARLLRQQGQTNEAKQLDLKIASLAQGLSAPSTEAKSKDTAAQSRVHAIWLSHAKELKPGDARSLVNVYLTETSHPIDLVLCSPAIVFWRVHLSPGAHLNKVCVWSQRNAHLDGIPTGVQVRKRFDQYVPLSTPYEKTAECTHLIYEIAKLSGNADIASIQAKHVAGDIPWVVGPQSQEWRAQRLIPELETLLAKRVANKRLLIASTVNTEFIAMPYSIESDLNVNAIARLQWPDKFIPDAEALLDSKPVTFREQYPEAVVLSDKDTFFILTGGHPAIVDRHSGAATSIRIVDPALPFTPNDVSLTYDTKRRHAVLKDSMHWYSYDAAQNKWSVMNEIKMGDGQDGMAASGQITYSAKDDCLYLMRALDSHNEGYDHILKYDPRGRYLGRIKLPEVVRTNDIVPSEKRDPDLQFQHHQIFSAGPYVVTIASPVFDLKNNRPAISCCVVDPSTGKVINSSFVRLQR